MTVFRRQHWQHEQGDILIRYISPYPILSIHPSRTTLIRAAFKWLMTHSHTHNHIHTNTLKPGIHCLITEANLVKTITQLIESSLVDECIKHTRTQTHTQARTYTQGCREEESLQGRLSYLLSHFSYHLGFVNSQWGGNAISGAAHSSLRSAKKERERKRHTPFPQSITHDKVATLRGDVERKAHIL